MSRAARRLRGSWLVRMVADGRQHGECQHDQADMAVPSVPGPALVVVEAELVLGSLEAVLDGPALPFHRDKGVDARAGRAPSGKERARAVGDAAPDQQAARPQAMAAGIALGLGVEVGQFHIRPVVDARPFGARAGKGYVLGQPSTQQVWSSGARPDVAGTAEDVAAALAPSDWQCLSAGAGTKGPRVHRPWLPG